MLAVDFVNVTLQASLLEANKASANGGGASMLGDSFLRLSDGTTLRDNSAGQAGGGLFVAGLGAAVGECLRLATCGMRDYGVNLLTSSLILVSIILLNLENMCI